MNIIEAFKNHGKAYRPGWAFTIAVQDNRFYRMPDHTILYLLPEDVFANDWIRVTEG